MGSYVVALVLVSIHAPRVRCDSWYSAASPGHTSFNPRTSCEVRLGRDAEFGGLPAGFNPRTSCEVRRKPGTGFLTWTRCFNPRTSCEVRPLAQSPIPEAAGFNPRTSCEVRRQGRYPADVQVGRGCFAPTCLSEGYFQPAVYCFHDVNMQSSITCSNRRCPGNFL